MITAELLGGYEKNLKTTTGLLVSADIGILLTNARLSPYESLHSLFQHIVQYSKKDAKNSKYY